MKFAIVLLLATSATALMLQKPGKGHHHHGQVKQDGDDGDNGGECSGDFPSWKCIIHNADKNSDGEVGKGGGDGHITDEEAYDAGVPLKVIKYFGNFAGDDEKISEEEYNKAIQYAIDNKLKSDKKAHEIVRRDGQDMPGEPPK
jgi:hypothetical protein